MSTKKKHRTYFSCMIHFPDVQNSSINTAQFLEAARSIVDLVEKLGKVFAPVKYDMSNNVEKIDSVYRRNKLRYTCLHDILLHEKEENQRFATSALQWLRRGLHFISKFFDTIIKSHERNENSEHLEPLLKESYAETLKPYHGWMIQNVFHVLCRMCLTRSELFKILSCNDKNCDDIIIEHMIFFNVNLKNCVRNLTSFYVNNGIESTERV